MLNYLHDYLRRTFNCRCLRLAAGNTSWRTGRNLSSCSYVLQSNCPFMIYRLYVPVLHNYYVFKRPT